MFYKLYIPNYKLYPSNVHMQIFKNRLDEQRVNLGVYNGNNNSIVMQEIFNDHKEEYILHFYANEYTPKEWVNGI